MMKPFYSYGSGLFHPIHMVQMEVNGLLSIKIIYYAQISTKFNTSWAHKLGPRSLPLKTHQLKEYTLGSMVFIAPWQVQRLAEHFVLGLFIYLFF